MLKIINMDKLFNMYETEICKYCGITNYGDCEANTNQYNLCEGGNTKYNCETALMNLIESLSEEEIDDLIKAGLVEKVED